MQQRFKSAQACLESALKLARTERLDDAKQVLAELVDYELTPFDLRMLANVASRCRMYEDAIRALREIEQLDVSQPGDSYMQGVAHMELSKLDEAVSCFEREVDMVQDTGDITFLESAAFPLAYVLYKQNQPERAKEVLRFIKNDDDTFFIPHVGVRTKAGLMREMRGA